MKQQKMHSMEHSNNQKCCENQAKEIKCCGHLVLQEPGLAGEMLGNVIQLVISQSIQKNQTTTYSACDHLPRLVFVNWKQNRTVWTSQHVFVTFLMFLLLAQLEIV